MSAPATATHYLPRPDVTPQMWYRAGCVKLNTGEIAPTLEYLSFCDIWQGANAPTHGEVMASLIKIQPDATQ